MPSVSITHRDEQGQDAEKTPHGQPRSAPQADGGASSYCDGTVEDDSTPDTQPCAGDDKTDDASSSCQPCSAPQADTAAPCCGDGTSEHDAPGAQTSAGPCGAGRGGPSAYNRASGSDSGKTPEESRTTCSQAGPGAAFSKACSGKKPEGFQTTYSEGYPDAAAFCKACSGKTPEECQAACGNAGPDGIFKGCGGKPGSFHGLRFARANTCPHAKPDEAGGCQGGPAGEVGRASGCRVNAGFGPC